MCVCVCVLVSNLTVGLSVCALVLPALLSWSVNSVHEVQRGISMNR